MKYHFLGLIIWRSQVQALAGPLWKSSTYKDFAGAFSLFCEQFANIIAFREHQYNLSAIIDSLILFANPIIFIRKSFSAYYSVISVIPVSTFFIKVFSDGTPYYSFSLITTQWPALVLPSRTNTPIFCIAATSRLIVLSASDKTSDISLTQIGH